MREDLARGASSAFSKMVWPVCSAFSVAAAGSAAE